MWIFPIIWLVMILPQTTVFDYNGIVKILFPLGFYGLFIVFVPLTPWLIFKEVQYDNAHPIRGRRSSFPLTGCVGLCGMMMTLIPMGLFIQDPMSYSYVWYTTPLGLLVIIGGLITWFLAIFFSVRIIKKSFSEVAPPKKAKKYVPVEEQQADHSGNSTILEKEQLLLDRQAVRKETIYNWLRKKLPNETKFRIDNLVEKICTAEIKSPEKLVDILQYLRKFNGVDDSDFPVVK